MKKIFTKLLTFALLFGFINSTTANTALLSSQGSTACPTLDDVMIPGTLNVTDSTIMFSTGIQELRPEDLMENYGFSEADVLPTWEDIDDCGSIVWTYEDIAINYDDTSFKIIRKWTVLDWLTAEYIQPNQIIKINLVVGSQSYCLDSYTASVSPWTCTAPAIGAQAFLQPGFNYENLSMTTDPPVSEFELGVYDVLITGNLGTDTFTCNSTLFVQDFVPPVIVTAQNTDFALDANCMGTLTPEMIDNGSHDGACGGVTLSIEPSTLTAADAGTTVTVFLTGVDEAGNSNTTWAYVNVAECGPSSSLACIQLITVADLNSDGVQLFAEDFLTSNSTNSGDLGLTIEDALGNIITDGYLPQGSGGSFEYTVTDNVTGESCSGIIQAPLAFDPCLYLACKAYVSSFLPESGISTFTPQDFALNTETCTDLILDIFDENSNLLFSGTSIDLTESGSYLYQVTNTEGNSCWGTLVLGEYTPCPTTLACNNNIFVSMYVPSGSSTQIAIINSDMLLEGNTNGCDLASYFIEINDNGTAGNSYSGTGSVEVDEPGLYTFTITNAEGISCWGTLDIQGTGNCQEIDDVVFPPDLDLTIVGITGTNLSVQVSPESLVNTYGYNNEDVYPVWPLVNNCENLIYTYEDQLFDFGDTSFKILRTWTVLDWLTADISTHVQIINNNINPGLICDFLPNSAELGECASGHTDTDDVEWPDDLAIADYRIKPADLIAYSLVDPNDAEPILVNNEDIYSIDYIDILQQLQVNSITVNRVWTVSSNGINVATYTQVLQVDISGFASLVAVNTMFNRPIPEVMLSNGSQPTNDQGIGFVDDVNPLNPSKPDTPYNGVNIRDLVLIQQHILGLRSLEDLQLIAADYNDDSSVSAIDLVEITKTITEIGSATNADWLFIDNPFTEEDDIQTKARYIGIKPGDVDDDANLGEASTLETGTMLLEDVLINNGENYQTRLQYAGEELSLGVEVHLYYDASLISVNNLYVDNPEMRLDFNLDIPGEIHLTLNKVNALGFLFAGENLINIEFTATSNGLLSQAIEGTSPRDSYLLGLDLELITLYVDIVDQIDTGTKDVIEHNEFFKVYPNPVSDNLTFDFINGTPEDFEITLFNINGQFISTYNNETNIDVAYLPSGIHFYRLTQNGQTYAGRFNVIR